MLIFFNSLLIPERAGEFVLKNERIYNPGNLFDYIDGSAEVYLAYGFKKLNHFSYQDKTGNEIVLDIFEMESSNSAFGLFTHNMENFQIERFGLAERGANLHRFFYQNFYLTVSPLAFDAQTLQAAAEIADRVDKQLADFRFDFPEIFKLLPAKNIISGTRRYFFHANFVNQLLFISSENIWQKKKQRVEFAQALYRFNTQPVLFMIVKYKSRKEAVYAYKTLIKFFKPDENGIFRHRQKTCALKAEDKLIKILFYADSSEEIKILMNQEKIANGS